jgi:hypothetical protein
MSENATRPMRVCESISCCRTFVIVLVRVGLDCCARRPSTSIPPTSARHEPAVRGRLALTRLRSPATTSPISSAPSPMRSTQCRRTAGASVRSSDRDRGPRCAAQQLTHRGHSTSCEMTLRTSSVSGCVSVGSGVGSAQASCFASKRELRLAAAARARATAARAPSASPATRLVRVDEHNRALERGQHARRSLPISANRASAKSRARTEARGVKRRRRSVCGAIPQRDRQRVGRGSPARLLEGVGAVEIAALSSAARSSSPARQRRACAAAALAV